MSPSQHLIIISKLHRPIRPRPPMKIVMWHPKMDYLVCFHFYGYSLALTFGLCFKRLTSSSCLAFVSWFHFSLREFSSIRFSFLFLVFSWLSLFFLVFHFCLLLFAYGSLLAFASCFYFSLLTFSLWLVFAFHYYLLFLASSFYLALAFHFCVSLLNFVFAFHF